MIKKRVLVLCCLVILWLPAAEKKHSKPLAEKLSHVELSREKSTRSALPIVLGLVGHQSPEFEDFGKELAHDLGYSGQCKVAIRSFDTVQKKEIMNKLFKEGFLLAIFVQLKKNKSLGAQSFEVRLYDTAHKTMLLGKRFSYIAGGVRCWAHTIADVLWHALTGQPGIFSTKIAYCKKVERKRGPAAKHIYMCDYDGRNEERIVETATINVAPRWNRELASPRLFYSEYTNENVRLMIVNMRKQRSIVSSLDGVTMVPAFSRDGTSIVYCASRGKGSCQLFLVKNGRVRQLTKNTGNNVSPVFSRDDSTIFFCSDYETGLPQICTYRLSDGLIERVTSGGSCVSPACSTRHDKVAYAKTVRGVMQIMLYDPLKKTHEQITFGAGNKEECSWSPCGSYLVYSQEEGNRGALVSLNMQTKKSKVLTLAQDVCSYPAWSPVYQRIPSLGGVCPLRVKGDF